MNYTYNPKTSNSFIKFINPDFIHSDDRGTLVQLCSQNKWGQVNYIKSLKKSFRGNHFHDINKELFYVISGKFDLILELNQTKYVYEIIEKDMFIIEPKVTHSFNYKDDTLLITMYDKGVQLENGIMDIKTNQI